MSVEFHVGRLDDPIAEALRWRAAQHGRSVDAEVKTILRTALLDNRRGQAVRIMDAVRARTSDRMHTPAEVLVRKTRYDR